MAPRFWYRPPGPLLRLIGPLGRGVRGTVPVPSPIPVVAVGSLARGGTGKTPMVIALAQRLVMRGKAVHVVTRGEGAPLRVDERAHSAADIGDEPLLIAAFAPTWVAREPADGVRAAAAAGAEIVVLDGGGPAGPVAAKLRVLVEDAARGFGNGFAWPFGPLKTRLKPGLAEADLVVTIGSEAMQDQFRRSWGAQIPCHHVPGRLAPLETGMEWAGLEVVAFAGIAAPERFFASLRALGANLVRAQALVDHQELTDTLMARLENEARMTGAQLVTTEKDAVRLPRAFRQKVISLPVRLDLESWERIDAALP